MQGSDQARSALSRSVSSAIGMPADAELKHKQTQRLHVALSAARARADARQWQLGVDLLVKVLTLLLCSDQAVHCSDRCCECRV